MGGAKAKIDRFTIGAALVFAVGVSLYWWMFYDAGYSSGRHEERAHIEREHYAAETADYLSKQCGGFVGAALRKCTYEAVKAEHEAKREESDLAAQWKAADWVFWAAIVGGAQLVITAVGLFFIKRTLDANWGAIDAMQDANRISRAGQRPWVDFEIAKISMFTSDHEFATEVEIRLINLGEGPAFNARCKARITTTNGQKTDFGDFYPPTEEAGRTHNILPKGQGYDRLYPRMEAVKLNMVRILVRSETDPPVEPTPPQFFPNLEVEVTYQWGEEAANAVTRKTFGISSVPSSHPRDRVKYPIQLGTVPLPELTAFEVGIAEIT